jgi:hypothetical protein
MHMTFPQEDIPAYERRRTAARLAARVRGFTLTYSALEEALDVFETLEARLIAHATNVFAVTGQIQGGTSL